MFSPHPLSPCPPRHPDGLSPATGVVNPFGSLKPCGSAGNLFLHHLGIDVSIVFRSKVYGTSQNVDILKSMYMIPNLISTYTLYIYHIFIDWILSACWIHTIHRMKRCHVSQWTYLLRWKDVFYGRRVCNIAIVSSCDRSKCGSKVVILPSTGNPCFGYINPYYWVDDYPQTQGTNGSWSTPAHIL